MTTTPSKASGVSGSQVSEEDGLFVLDLASNPHPDLLADALMIRANARSATERLGPLKDYDIDWRLAWRFTLRTMCKATGCPPEDFDAWLDRHEADEVACEISEGS